MIRFLAVMLAVSAVAADWPRFRGPNGTGLTDAAPTTWTRGAKPLWTADLPGIGNGSPIIAGGKVFVQTAKSDGSNRSVVAYDAATGKHLWTQSESGSSAHTHAKNSLASSTPACDGERVFACFWDGKDIHLHAYSTDGKPLWHKTLGGFSSQHGVGLSPITHNGMVFVNYDQDGAAAIVAYDAKTGDQKWNEKRKAFRASYSTPFIRDIPGGNAELVVLSTAGVTGYEPASGKILWDWTIPWGKQAGLRSVASPVMIGDIVIALTGDGSGDRFCAGVVPGKEPKVVWQQKSSKLAPYVPCPVAVGQHLYWVTDQGIVECINPKTGKAVWSERVFNASVSASPIVCGDTILMIDEKGKAISCKANPKEFDKVGESEVGSPVFATPAAADGRLIVRAGSQLICHGAK